MIVIFAILRARLGIEKVVPGYQLEYLSGVLELLTDVNI